MEPDSHRTQTDRKSVVRKSRFSSSVVLTRACMCVFRMVQNQRVWETPFGILFHPHRFLNNDHDDLRSGVLFAGTGQKHQRIFITRPPTGFCVGGLMEQRTACENVREDGGKAWYVPPRSIRKRSRSHGFALEAHCEAHGTGPANAMSSSPSSTGLKNMIRKKSDKKRKNRGSAGDRETKQHENEI